jgi:hypothetical protein
MLMHAQLHSRHTCSSSSESRPDESLGMECRPLPLLMRLRNPLKPARGALLRLSSSAIGEGGDRGQGGGQVGGLSGLVSYCTVQGRGGRWFG